MSLIFDMLHAVNRIVDAHQTPLAVIVNQKTMNEIFESARRNDPDRKNEPVFNFGGKPHVLNRFSKELEAWTVRRMHYTKGGYDFWIDFKVERGAPEGFAIRTGKYEAPKAIAIPTEEEIIAGLVEKKLKEGSVKREDAIFDMPEAAN